MIVAIIANLKNEFARMITAIEIENLKCFSERQRIEFAPITLLYGPNNSGKSTAMYALLLFGQWLESFSYSLGPIELTGGERTLGPSHFATHNHRNGQPITIKVEIYDSESKTQKAIEICVQPGGNDVAARFNRRFGGDVVKLVHVKFEDSGCIIGDSWNDYDCDLIREELLGHIRKQRIVGAIRDVPPVGFIPKIPFDVERSLWFRGLAAWHWIGHAFEDNLIFTNQWLGPEYLDTGVELLQQKLIESSQLLDALSIKFPNGENLTKANLQLCLQELFTGCDRRVRLRPLQGKNICNGEEPLLSPHEVGVGVTQLLPVVVACMTRNDSFFMIQEPESHVHPRLQAKIGDLLIDSTADHLGYGKPNQLMVESHSEHLIHRLKRRIRQTTKGDAPRNLELRADRVAINYFNQTSGKTKVGRIRLDVNGEFVEPWPDDFFDIDFNERFS
jgi:hypothetical protein